jgi:hypothetical protein
MGTRYAASFLPLLILGLVIVLTASTNPIFLRIHLPPRINWIFEKGTVLFVLSSGLYTAVLVRIQGSKV